MYQLTFVFFFVLVVSVIVSVFCGDLDAIAVTDRQFEDPKLKRQRRDPLPVLLVKLIPAVDGTLAALAVFFLGSNYFAEIDLLQMAILAIVPLVVAAGIAWVSAWGIRRWVLPPLERKNPSDRMKKD